MQHVAPKDQRTSIDLLARVGLLEGVVGLSKMSSQEGLHEGLEEPWGQLVSVSGGSEAERVPIVGEKFTVGRSKGSLH